MDRRFFLKSAAAAAAVAGTTDIATAAGHISSLGEEPESKPLIASAPMLQNFAETSIGVAFAVNDLANGYVLIGERKDLQDARKVLCGGYRLADIDDRVIQVRITGLKPATKYYYRIGADRIHYGGGYDMKVLGNEEDPRVYSFTTAGKDLKGKFCVINDTHVRWNAIGPELDKIAEIAPACVIWNGDASNTEEKLENITICAASGLGFAAYIMKQYMDSCNRLFMDESVGEKITRKVFEAAIDLAGQEDSSFDSVYFDPMFRYPLMDSENLSPLRSLADSRALTEETVAEACRVARKRVVMKENARSLEFERLGFKTIMGGKYSKVHYGVMML